MSENSTTQFNSQRLFYERFITDGDITLFSPHDVPGLYDAFGTDAFDDLYQFYESQGHINKKTIKASGTYSESIEGESRDWSHLSDEP